jgi:hypothetical protein
MTTLSHSASKTSVHLAAAVEVPRLGPLTSMCPTLAFWLLFSYIMCSTLAFWIDDCKTCARLSHSGLISVSDAPNPRILARLMYQMCSTLAIWLDFNQNLQIPISLNASSQHFVSIQPASSRHPASIQPAGIQPASNHA